MDSTAKRSPLLITSQISHVHHCQRFPLHRRGQLGPQREPLRGRPEQRRHCKAPIGRPGQLPPGGQRGRHRLDDWQGTNGVCRRSPVRPEVQRGRRCCRRQPPDPRGHTLRLSSPWGGLPPTPSNHFARFQNVTRHHPCRYPAGPDPVRVQ